MLSMLAADVYVHVSTLFDFGFKKLCVHVLMCIHVSILDEHVEHVGYVCANANT